MRQPSEMEKRMYGLPHFKPTATTAKASGRFNLYRPLCTAFGTLLGAILSQHTAAQPQSEDPVLEQIIVYGSRTSNTLEDTLGSVAVISRKDIEDMDLRSFRETFRIMANVMDSDWVDGGFIIRGVNSEGLTPGGNPLASLYIDGVQQTVNGARRGSRGVWDVEQVEVYRGPQSTLSGRASLAGAVYIKTRDPQFDWDASVRGIYGTDDLTSGAITLGGPLLKDQLAFRVAAEYETSEFGDIKYPTYKQFDRYDNYVKDEYYQVRGKLLYLPANLPDTRALLSFSTAEDSPSARDIAGPVLGFEYDDRRGEVNAPVYTEPREAQNDNAALEINHVFNPAYRFTSLSTWSDSDTDRPSINEGTPGETEVTEGEQHQELFTQEFRINYDGERLSGTAGLYYADDQTVLHSKRNAYGREDISKGTRDTANYALFSEVTWTFTEDWRLIAGGRADYTDQKNTLFFSRNGEVTTDHNSSFDEFVFLPKLGLAYDLDQNQVIGFTVQEGFRTGGAGVQRSSGGQFTFDPEYTWNYELSYKGSFADGRLRLASNIFYTDWDDQQVEFQEIPQDYSSTITVNAASSKSYGFEFEGQYQLTETLSSFVSAGYVKTEFSEFVDVSLGDLSGLPFPEAPEWNLVIGGRYEHPSGFYFGVDAKYIDNYLARFGAPPQEYLDSYWTANAQAGWNSEHWEIGLFAENVFDEKYFVYNDRNDAGDIAATLGYPQRVGVAMTYNFF